MESVNIDILNPKAKKLLQSLADLDLIKINGTKKETNFLTIVERLRKKPKNKISMDEITEEVELVRKLNHESQKSNS